MVEVKKVKFKPSGRRGEHRNVTLKTQNVSHLLETSQYDRLRVIQLD